VNTKVRSVSRVALVGVGLFAVASAAFAGPPRWAHARYDDRYEDDGYDYARVIDVDPIVRHVRVDAPQRECWDETRVVESYPRRGFDVQTGGPTLLGAVIGGVVGHQFGHGRGRDAATIAGTLIGASVGRNTAVRAAGPDYGEERTVQRCAVRYEENWEDRVDGYRVRYEYHGREYTTQLPYDPGNKLRIQVDVQPAE
jgi:uncharacterized protein YcfJ